MLTEFSSEFSRQLTPQIWQLIAMSSFETVYMSLVATLFAVLFGLPLGVLNFDQTESSVGK